MMYAVASQGKCYHLVENTLLVFAPDGRRHAYSGDNCPDDCEVKRAYLPFTWCGLHVVYANEDDVDCPSNHVKEVAVPRAGLKVCIRCHKTQERRNKLGSEMSFETGAARQ